MPPFLPLLAKLAPTIIGAASSLFQNKKSRDFSRETYKTQYDQNLKNWHRQNRYNDPSAQMQRLQDAGLNPMMMYGGSGGAASSGQASTQVKTPDVQRPEFNQLDTSQAIPNIMSTYDIAIKKAQKGLLDQKIINESLTNKGNLIDFPDKRRLTEISVDGAEQNVNLSYQRAEDIRRKNIVNEDGHNIDQVLKNKTAKVKLAIDRIILEIRENKGNPNDPAWQKYILDLIAHPEKLKKALKTLFN